MATGVYTRTPNMKTGLHMIGRTAWNKGRKDPNAKGRTFSGVWTKERQKEYAREWYKKKTASNKKNEPRIPWNKGKKGHLSEETINKMKSKTPPMLGKKHSKEAREKMSLKSKGKKKTMEHRGKNSQQMKERYKNGYISPFKKIWNNNPNFNKGENNSNWKGGISKIDKKVRLMSECKKWKSEVFQRDEWTCQTCHSKGYVTAHHIKSFSTILKEYKISNQEEARKCSELWDINNGVTLCEECHSLTDNYKGRNKNNKQ